MYISIRPSPEAAQHLHSLLVNKSSQVTSISPVVTYHCEHSCCFCNSYVCCQPIIAEAGLSLVKMIFLPFISVTDLKSRFGNFRILWYIGEQYGCVWGGLYPIKQHSRIVLISNSRKILLLGEFQPTLRTCYDMFVPFNFLNLPDIHGQ